ncbi:hypothetical protein F5Y19DRAFT_485014 [Xylariaceae sp. FL1651]|nr:hypothetical protein F5Y19DRAFT_485014 [Xylariaceae sp. FL1651]
MRSSSRMTLLSIAASAAQTSPFWSRSSQSHFSLITRGEPALTIASPATRLVDPGTLSQGEYLVTLVNSHTKALTTQHVHNEDAPGAIFDDVGILDRSSTAYFALPTNWAGRVAFAEADYPLDDRASLIEGSFRVQTDIEAQVALDVSYVDGFTVPIVCECAGIVQLGCNLNLLNMCPDEFRRNGGTCINPWRDGREITNNFFKDCSPMAYTHPQDDLATVNGIPGCEKRIKCCVGTACAPHPKQTLCPAADGGVEGCPQLGLERTDQADTYIMEQVVDRILSRIDVLRSFKSRSPFSASREDHGF